MNSSKRHIKPGNEYNKYFKAPLGEDPMLHVGDVYSTLDTMESIINSTLNQTEAIAKVLKGSEVHQTAKNIWNFLYTHVQYTEDEPNIEQLRTPNRLWADRAKGVDCDCYSIFISSVLTNLNIPHSIRIAAYNNKPNFQHVYVVIPYSKKSIIIDPVLHQFNKEKPFTKKFDKVMIQHQALNGFNGVGNLPFGQEFDSLNGLGTVNSSDALNTFKQHLKNTFDILAVNPEHYEGVVDVDTYKAEIAYALENWDNPVARNAVLEELTEMEEMGEKLPVNEPLSGFFSNWRRKYSNPVAKQKVEVLRARRKQTPNVVPATIQRGTIQKNPVLAKVQAKLQPKAMVAATAKKPHLKNIQPLAAKQTLKCECTSLSGFDGLGGFWSKLKDGVKTATSKVATSFKNAGDKIKAAGAHVLANNPVSFGVRKALLFALDKNVLNLASRLKPAYYTSAQARTNQFDMSEYAKIVNVRKKVEDIFKKIGGDPAELKNAILHGKAGGLGSAVVVAGGAAAASGVIAQIVSFFKNINFGKLVTKAKNFANNFTNKTNNLLETAKKFGNNIPFTPGIIPSNSKGDDSYNGSAPQIQPRISPDREGNNYAPFVMLGVFGLAAGAYFLTAKSNGKKSSKGVAGTQTNKKSKTPAMAI
ncbi:MAG: hypothetical protein R3279_07485 [Putridiphycobacter sp.]|nr:hypothetical protein [Putridiphycobacter sp.]